MFDTTLMIALEGDVSLSQFRRAIEHFENLLGALTKELSPEETIHWDLENLAVGSAIVTVSGRAEREEPVLRVINAYETIGQSLQMSNPLPFSMAVVREARAIVNLIDSSITSIRFETAQKEAIIYGVFDVQRGSTLKPMTAFGTVKGRVQAISNRNKLRFTLYDAVFDKAVNCYIDENQQAILTDIWNQTVVVSGRITRQPDTGQPINVREVTAIDPVLPAVLGGYRRARGVLAGMGQTQRAEESTRQLRDGETNLHLL